MGVCEGTTLAGGLFRRGALSARGVALPAASLGLPTSGHLQPRPGCPGQDVGLCSHMSPVGTVNTQEATGRSKCRSM